MRKSVRVLLMANSACWQKFKSLLIQFNRSAFREKSLRLNKEASYRKPTQVGEARSLRGTSDSSLRNSANKRP